MKKKPFLNISFWLKFLGVILLVYLIYKVGWKETFASFKKVSGIHILVSVFILWMAYYLKSIRWRIISNSYGISLGSYKASKVFFIGLFLANITPGRLGDFGRLLYIKDNLPTQKIGWSSLIMDRLFDLICLLFFSFTAILYYQFNFYILKFPREYETIVYWVVGGIGLFLLLFRFKKKFKKIVKPWWEAFNSHNLGWFKTILSFVITCISMILIYGVFNYIAWAMGIEIDHLGLFLGTFILGILSLLPITVLGIGVRETSLVLIFQLYLLPAEDAIALSLIIFLIQLISLIPGAIWFYLSPIRLKDLKHSK
ncbi:lysylphosphatidylglycerol synthase transmembrane domain-containing protein [Aquimarina sp. 2201CG14-23]|uniref:lysylphosphatidylglycerol synthase transmembrane domain-containing protein n=1 Tax=Aquimarina mycalae TaxID=3040073 RepID=UPI002477CD0E|nr:lysylphosphatidylglycerol synthase transmembrane domain-containing protein [Aquimarina sp. 2201CG14-23]MDH7445057.1 lysylphosphatidylglycerol synthase transmembrane domain-containing protein [Aquimarina sp. 2201CG14-23]